VVIVDANVLLYAVNESMRQHAQAKRWVEGALSGEEPVGFAWVVLLAFVRIATLPALSPDPLTPQDACGLVEDWLGADPATVVAPTARHLGVLRGFLEESGTAGNLTTDAHLAALAVEHGARICSFDRDFARFRGVRCFAPS
jgi:uncharacterized protein